MTADPAARRLPRAPFLSSGGNPGSTRSPSVVWLRHYLEMVVAMYVGMAFLEPLVSGLVTALGQPDLHTRQPAAATLAMALEMVAPMAVWMDHRGHAVREIAEMAVVTFLPAPALILLLGADAMSAYHLSMFPAMAALMAYRRSRYLGGHHSHPPSDPG